MQKRDAVAEMLSVDRYADRWPLIPRAELEASAVDMHVLDKDGATRRVLMHRRRLRQAQLTGDDPALVCADCHEAFGASSPWLCKYSLANDMWLGRWDPLFRNANLSHQMLLALARVVATKIVLRPEGRASQGSDTENKWDFLFHQAGMIGSAILFANADCGSAMPHFPPTALGDTFAVSFVAKPSELEEPDAASMGSTEELRAEGLSGAEARAQGYAKARVSKIAKLKVDRREFDQQAAALKDTNVVFNTTEYRADLVASWVPDATVPTVPPVILNSVVAVPLADDAGTVVSSGPGDATAAGEEERLDADVEASRQARYISAFETQVADLNESTTSGTMEVVSLINQLQELEQAAQRSVAAEMETAIEANPDLIDDAGRERILKLCQDVRRRCQRLSSADMRAKLEWELQQAAVGSPTFLHDDSAAPDAANGLSSGAPADDTPPANSAPQEPRATDGSLALLEVPRARAPLSLWDWTIWTQARPTLWRYGDATNLYPHRQTLLLTQEWMECMCNREELEYAMPTDSEPYSAAWPDEDFQSNRFEDDWLTMHLFATLYLLSEQKQSAFAFLKNGGMKWAAKVRGLSAEMLALAARVAPQAGIQALAQNQHVPQLVRDALNAMQAATANVVGTDGHRRLCRHEGIAYMSLFGPPLVFMTPNLADNKQPLLLVVQGYELRLDVTPEACPELPKYRDMMRRLARDPVKQTVVFEKIMTLFFLHVLGVRPECLHNRRKAARSHTREWCTDGIAASSCAPGILGPVLAFRGEIEAQGRGSLHPHILVWLVCLSAYEVLTVLQRDRDMLQPRLREWMRAVVAATEATNQASIQALPRRFGDVDSRVAPLGFSKVERRLTCFDGGSEIDTLRAEGDAITDAQAEYLKTADPEEWTRPKFQLRAADGQELEEEDAVAKPPSVYTRPLNSFAVSQLPDYRRFNTLSSNEQSTHEGDTQSAGIPQSTEAATGLSRGATATADDLASRGDPTSGMARATRTDAMDAAAWEHAFAEDIRKLASEILVHICGESCYKYSGAKVQKICRHGFYYIVTLETRMYGDEKDWQRRRQGKPLRNAIFVVKESEHGLQGRLLHFQEHPFECQTNYAGLGALRCNLDVQDLRRVLDEPYWRNHGEAMPHIGDRPEWGYMNVYEWNGHRYEGRVPEDVEVNQATPAEFWCSAWRHDGWRKLFLDLLASDGSGEPTEEEDKMLKQATDGFRDGINTGFYINSYTTKHCPTMAGVLEELRGGIERLENQRQSEKETLESRRKLAADQGLSLAASYSDLAIWSLSSSCVSSHASACSSVRS